MGESWLDFVINPQAVASLFDAAPRLVDVDVSRLRLDRDGPALELVLLLRCIPDRLPKRWRGAPNAVALSIDFFGVAGLSLSNWGTDNSGFTLSLRRLDQGKNEAIGNSPSLCFRFSFVFAQISTIQPYQREIPNGPTPPRGGESIPG